MRLRVQHQTVYRYEKPIPYSIQTLRVSPRPYEGCAVLEGVNTTYFIPDGWMMFIDSYGNGSLNRL